MKIAGIIIIAFGIIDLVGSYTGLDLWGEFGVELPEFLWTYSAYIEMALGYVVMTLGSRDRDE